MTTALTEVAWIRRTLWHAPVIALAVSVALNVSFSMKLRAAEERAKPGLHIGSRVAPLTFPAASGLPQIVYHFSASCGWCERNWASINALAERVKGRYQVVGVSIGELPPGFVEKRHLAFPVIDGLPKETVNAYRLAATPQTIVVSPDGTVRQSWFGAYSRGLAKDVGTYFGVQLPVLAPMNRETPGK